MPVETIEIIEGQAHEVETSRAVALVTDHGMTATGPLALAGLSDEEFDRRLAALDTMRTRVARMQKALMVLDVDYGTIPGTPKPTLLKPGAEKLCQAYGLAADFAPERIAGDGLTVPALAYQTRCDLHLGSLDGLIVAVGYGSANSWERKHRYRNAELICPDCGNATGTVKKSKREPGWYCWQKIGGCGATFRPDDVRVRDQVVGQVENSDPWDLDTTLLKMAEKRAFVDATLRATAASGLFTQDMEDLPRSHDELQASEGRPQRPLGTHDAPPDRPQLVRQTQADGLVGKLVTQGTQDFHLRQTPDGFMLPFRVKDGRQSVIVMAEDDLAVALDAVREQALDQTVTVWGTFSDETYEKTDPKTGQTLTLGYKVLHLARIASPDFTLPAEEAATAPLFPDEDLADLIS